MRQDRQIVVIQRFYLILILKTVSGKYFKSGVAWQELRVSRNDGGLVHSKALPQPAGFQIIQPPYVFCSRNTRVQTISSGKLFRSGLPEPFVAESECPCLQGCRVSKAAVPAWHPTERVDVAGQSGVKLYLPTWKQTSSVNNSNSLVRTLHKSSWCTRTYSYSFSFLFLLLPLRLLCLC